MEKRSFAPIADYDGSDVPLNWVRLVECGILGFMAWLLLLFAGFLEAAWAFGLRWSGGFTRLGPSLFTLVTMAGSLWLLARAVQTLPLGTAYAVWTGIGATLTALIGIIFLEEPRNLPRLIFLGLIVIGIIGLKFSTAE